MYVPRLFLSVSSLFSIAIASQFRGRQVGPGNSSTNDLIAQCAPEPFLVRQFTTFNGSDTSAPQISFFFENGNGVDINKGESGATIFCSVTLPMFSDIMSDYAVWSCEVGEPSKRLA